MTATERNIYLIGPMGSGKTAVGRQLARELNRRFYDSDHEIERRTGVEISLIFEKEGEDGFRSRERAMIDTLSELEDAVIATGGGAIMSEENRARLSATGTVIYLKPSVDEQLRRTRRNRARPLLHCVPCNNLTTKGVPPTSFIKSSVYCVEWANPDTANPIPFRANNCKLRSLSRERTMATDSLRLYTPIISNCRTTAVP